MNVHVKDIDALKKLKISLERFRDESQPLFHQIEAAFQKRQEALKVYEKEFTTQLNQADDARKQAHKDLQATFNLKYDDNRSKWNESTNLAKKQLDDADQTFKQAHKRWLACQKVVLYAKTKLAFHQENCQITLRKMNNQLAEPSIRALEQLISGLDDYTNIKVENGGTTASLPIQQATQVEKVNVHKTPFYQLRGNTADLTNAALFDKNRLDTVEAELQARQCDEIKVWAENEGEARLFLSNGYQYQEGSKELKKEIKQNPNRANEKSTYQAEKNEVFYCGQCKRQQQASEGTHCKICRSVTVSWYTERENAASAHDKWLSVNGQKYT